MALRFLGFGWPAADEAVGDGAMSSVSSAFRLLPSFAGEAPDGELAATCATSPGFGEVARELGVDAAAGRDEDAGVG